MGLSRRSVLLGFTVPVTGSFAGCSSDEADPGLHAIDTITLYRAGDGWYDFPSEAGVQVTVENTDIDRHQGTLTTTLHREDGAAIESIDREIELPGGTTRGYRIVFAVNATENTTFSASATIAH